MSKYTLTKDATTGAVTGATVEDRGLIDNVINGILDPISLSENETVEKKDVQFVAAEYGLAGLIIGSKLARSRVAAGKEPIFKVIG